MLWAFLSAAAIGLFWLGYRHPRRRRWLLSRQVAAEANVASVDRQHKHLLAGGRLGEAAVAATAARFRDMLLNGRAAELERELCPGVDFAIQVQALTRLGTDEARGVLERQLSRRLSRDPIEQTWYWADAASGLRQLRHARALPALLHCADSATHFPAGTILAAEVVSFPNFPTVLAELTGPLAHSALRAVIRVSRGCRDGVIDPASMLTVGLGEILAGISRMAPPLADPWLAWSLLEAERIHRRLLYWMKALPAELRPMAERQAERLRETARHRLAWLRRASDRLLERFTVAPSGERAAILLCLYELRTDIVALFPQLPDPRVAWWAEAMRCLRWSRSRVLGPVLARHVGDLMACSRTHHAATLMLGTLRGHACREAECELLSAGTSSCPEFRKAAATALGWWPPYNPSAVIRALQILRTDSADVETRRSAVAALARLGQRSALNEIRQELFSEEATIRATTARRIADAELSWLWPDLQDIADSDDASTALAALEAIERLREQSLGPLFETCF